MTTQTNITNVVSQNSELFGNSAVGLAHTLKLCISKALEDESIDDLSTKYSNLVGHFKHSARATHLFREIQNQLDLPKKFNFVSRTTCNFFFIE